MWNSPVPLTISLRQRPYSRIPRRAHLRSHYFIRPPARLADDSRKPGLRPSRQRSGARRPWAGCAGHSSAFKSRWLSLSLSVQASWFQLSMPFPVLHRRPFQARSRQATTGSSPFPIHLPPAPRFPKCMSPASPMTSSRRSVCPSFAGGIFRLPITKARRPSPSSARRSLTGSSQRVMQSAKPCSRERRPVEGRSTSVVTFGSLELLGMRAQRFARTPRPCAVPSRFLAARFSPVRLSVRESRGEAVCHYARGRNRSSEGRARICSHRRDAVTCHRCGSTSRATARLALDVLCRGRRFFWPSGACSAC
jgi:hypothetical protein